MQDIINTIDNFLDNWDRQYWMQVNNPWASEAWETKRAEYEAAREAVEAAREAVDAAVEATADSVDELPDAEHADAIGADEAFDGAEDAIDDVKDACEDLAKALAKLRERAQDLDDQVVPDEDDYILEGTIDPDGVADSATFILEFSRQQGWDCVESVDAYRHGDDLYMRWHREAWGERRHRDLWVVVDEEYFVDENEEVAS